MGGFGFWYGPWDVSAEIERLHLGSERASPGIHSAVWPNAREDRTMNGHPIMYRTPENARTNTATYAWCNGEDDPHPQCAQCCSGGISA